MGFSLLPFNPHIQLGAHVFGAASLVCLGRCPLLPHYCPTQPPAALALGSDSRRQCVPPGLFPQRDPSETGIWSSSSR